METWQILLIATFGVALLIFLGLVILFFGGLLLLNFIILNLDRAFTNRPARMAVTSAQALRADAEIRMRQSPTDVKTTFDYQ
ncbi:hypothetical protein F5Y01DRAFT_312917 [Xylaria sp. FL0043]|nr:hypothetical protein F5Y01DRAFT_312917 [Xylaria sp. FL0043]